MDDGGPVGNMVTCLDVIRGVVEWLSRRQAAIQPEAKLDGQHKEDLTQEYSAPGRQSSVTKDDILPLNSVGYLLIHYDLQ